MTFRFYGHWRKLFVSYQRVWIVILVSHHIQEDFELILFSFRFMKFVTLCWLIVHYWFTAWHIFGVQQCNAVQWFWYHLLQTGKSHIFLISWLTNASKTPIVSLTTILNFFFFPQARAIKELANKLFRALKADPQNFETECSMINVRPSRRIKAISGSLDSNSGNNTNGNETVSGACPCFHGSAFLFHERCINMLCVLIFNMCIQ